MNRVVFNTWAGAFFNPGGGEVQLMNTRSHLINMGFNVELYSQWSPQRSLDIFHQFSIQAGVEYPMSEYRQLGAKVALSSIFWAKFPKDSETYLYLRRIFSLADIILTNSDLESQLLSESYDISSNYFHRVVNGVSQEYLNRNTACDFRESYGIDGDFILTVANIDRRKNTHRLVEACKYLNKKLVVIGHVRDVQYFNEFKDSYEGFIYVGPIDSQSMLKSAYQQAVLFALPSLCETPGIAALEAGSQGAKIVITNEGAAPEYFDDLVTYIDPNSSNSILEGISIELKSSRKSDEIISHITGKYTWEIAAKQTAEGYRGLL